MAALTAMGQQTVSVADAKAKAAAFLNRSAGAKGGTVTTDVQLAYTAQQGNETYYYVFNNGSDGQGGFVIIGGDETARTILGYSDSGAFDPNNMPENMKWWLSQYEHQISAAIKSGGTTAAAKGGMGLTAINRADITPLCETTWDQVAPYNTAIPKIFSEYDYTSVNAPATGCVATAMAQIMKKYNRPTTGTGSHTDPYTTNSVTFSANFGSTTYQWDKMTKSYTGNTYSGTDAENAVATLMYHCGVAADMQYGLIGGKGSSASSFTAAQGMINYFNYDKGMSYEERAYYSDDDWAEMIYGELAAGRPVLYSGRTSDAGHAFVCDGYKYEDGNDLFDINWGWGGTGNGYFPLQGTNALKPGNSGTGGGTAGAAYNLSQSAVIGIQPNNGGSYVCKVTNPDGYTLSNNQEGSPTISSLNVGATLYMMGQFVNSSLETKTITYGVRLENTTSGENTYLSGSSRSRNPNAYPLTYKNGPAGYNLTITGVEAGQTYRVYPTYYDNAEDFPEWKDMVTTQNDIPTLQITEETELYLTDAPSFGRNGEYTVMDGTDEESLNLTLKFKNNTGADINNKNIVVWIFPDQSGQVSSRGYWECYLTIANGETKTITLNKSNTSNNLTITAGSRYYISVVEYIDQNNQPIFYEKAYFIPTNKQSISYKMTSAGWGTICLPFSAEVPPGLTVYEVTDVSGNELTKSEVSQIAMNRAYLVSGTAGTYSFSGPTTPTGQYTNGLLTGNTASGTVYAPKDSYVMQNQATNGLAFYKVAANDTQRCSQYKAYLTLPSGLSNLYGALLFTDGTTGIESIDATDNQQGAVRKVLKNGRLTIETPQGSFTPAGARMK